MVYKKYVHMFKHILIMLKYSKQSEIEIRN